MEISKSNCNLITHFVIELHKSVTSNLLFPTTGVCLKLMHGGFDGLSEQIHAINPLHLKPQSSKDPLVMSHRP